MCLLKEDGLWCTYWKKMKTKKSPRTSKSPPMSDLIVYVRLLDYSKLRKSNLSHFHQCINGDVLLVYDMFTLHRSV